MSSVATCTCPGCGAESGTADYCDGCGAALDPPAVPSEPEAPEAHGTTCPSCTAARTPSDAFCEVCGLDFTSGELPRAPADWTAVVEADRTWFDSNTVEAAGRLSFPHDLPPREVALRDSAVAVGRGDHDTGSFLDIDLSGDPGVSRRHAVLHRQADGSWNLTDEGSANGTWVNDAAAPAEPGRPIPLHDGDTVRLGAFSVLRMRRNGPA